MRFEKFQFVPGRFKQVCKGLRCFKAFKTFREISEGFMGIQVALVEFEGSLQRCLKGVSMRFKRFWGFQEALVAFNGGLKGLRFSGPHGFFVGFQGVTVDFLEVF